MTPEQIAAGLTEAVNLNLRTFIDSSGEQYPIVAMFDAEGDECEPDDAVSAVAGVEGRWFVIDLSEFEGAASNG